MTFNIRQVDLGKPNGRTKYPSILTYLALGNGKCRRPSKAAGVARAEPTPASPSDAGAGRPG
jgi:hypothetical protein